MELELRSHRWTDATRRESRSLSPLLEEERPSQGPGLLHFLRGVRDAFHILLARGRTSAIGYDVKIPRGGFTFEIKTFSPGKCCAALVHAPIERAKSGSLQWKRLSRWSIIERRFWYLVSLRLSLFSLSYRMVRFIVFGTTIAFTVTNENVHRPCDVQKSVIDILSSVTSTNTFKIELFAGF